MTNKKARNQINRDKLNVGHGTPVRTEKDITRGIRRVLKVLGIYHWKHWQGPMSYPKGISDIIGIMPDGRFLAIEVKKPGGKISPDQAKFLKRIEHNRGIAMVATSEDDVIDKLNAGKRFIR